jgi:hypothetical protein
MSYFAWSLAVWQVDASLKRFLIVYEASVLISGYCEHPIYIGILPNPKAEYMP